MAEGSIETGKQGRKTLNFFDKAKERSRVNKMADGGYNRKDLMAP